MKTLRVPRAVALLHTRKWGRPSSPPQYRAATCVVCGCRMHRMWHVWVKGEGYWKEIHFCRDCGKPYEVEIAD